MTQALTGKEASEKLAQSLSDSILASEKNDLLVKAGAVRDVISFLKTAPGLEFDFLSDLTAVDYFDYFEVVYHLTSLKNNLSIVVKARTPRQNPSLPSIVSLFQGADFQEREAYDLMGVVFEGHPNLKRIVTWEGFEGHPLRKDYL